MTSLRLRFRRGAWKALVDVLLGPLRASGTRTDPERAGSCASIFVDPGGSFKCDASVGRDHSEGVGLAKSVEGV